MRTRFWIWVNDGPVRISLATGQTLRHHTGGRCEEGYSYHYEEWTHDGDMIRRVSTYMSRDCDGRYTGGQDLVCPLSLLASHIVLDDPIRYPDWQVERELHRDHAAEAAGY